MKKKLASISVRANLRALSVRQKIKAHVKNCGGANQLTDNAGLIVLGITLVIVLVTWAVPYVRTTLLPMVGDKIKGIFDYSNS